MYSLSILFRVPSTKQRTGFRLLLLLFAHNWKMCHSHVSNGKKECCIRWVMCYTVFRDVIRAIEVLCKHISTLFKHTWQTQCASTDRYMSPNMHSAQCTVHTLLGFFIYALRESVRSEHTYHLRHSIRPWLWRALETFRIRSFVRSVCWVCRSVVLCQSLYSRRWMLVGVSRQTQYDL